MSHDDRPKFDNDRFDFAPDSNSEQEEGGTQAQDVAQDARHAPTDLSEDSERGGHEDPASLIPSDMSDLVEKMEEMSRSGHIDNDAYDGEPMMDDEEDILGETDSDEDPL